MKRSEFFSEIKKDLIQTFKEIISPLVEDDIEKIDGMIEKISGIKWVSIGHFDPETFHGVEDRFIEKVPVLIYSNGKEIQAVHKICPHCGGMLHWISYEKSIKCLQCERGFPLAEEEVLSELNVFQLKRKESEWYIALKDL